MRRTLSRRYGLTALVAFVTAGAACVLAPRVGPPDGALLSTTPYRLPAYDDLPDYEKENFSEDAWDAVRADDSVSCSRVAYASDGLSVTGFIVAPTGGGGTPRPALIFNRGGNRDMGKIGVFELLIMREFARSGYVVVASQYRGNDGGQGADEFGGRDVDDVLNLVPLVRSLDSVDPTRLYMVGHSRGGMMVYLALKRGAPVRAAVAWGAPTDLAALGRARPGMVRYVYSEIIPHFAKRPVDVLRERSAIEWPEALDAPLLLVHGDADRRVPASQAIQLASRLRALGKSCELVLYRGDDHMLSKDRGRAIERMKGWFRQHGGPPMPENAVASRR